MKVKIIFSTEVGTTKRVAELIQKNLSETGHQVDTFDVSMQKSEPQFARYDAILFGAPTYYSGKLEPRMAAFLSKLQLDLTQYKVAVFSLGDKEYEHFCASAEILKGWVEEQGGTLVLPPIKIDGFLRNHDEFKQWLQQLKTILS